MQLMKWSNTEEPAVIPINEVEPRSPRISRHRCTNTQRKLLLFTSRRADETAPFPMVFLLFVNTVRGSSARGMDSGDGT